MSNNWVRVGIVVNFESRTVFGGNAANFVEQGPVVVLFQRVVLGTVGFERFENNKNVLLAIAFFIRVVKSYVMWKGVISFEFEIDKLMLIDGSPVSFP